MIIKSKYKIEKAVSQDESYMLKDANLKGDILRATDGRICVKIPIEREEGDTDGQVKIEAIELARKSLKFHEHSIKLNGSHKLSNGAEISREEVHFPNIDAIEPVKGRQELALHIDFALLSRLVEAMGIKKGIKGSQAIKLRIPLEGPANEPRVSHSSIIVTAKNDNEVEGIIMPMRGE